MGIYYGLTVILVTFLGFIIQCNAVGDNVEYLPDLPDELIAAILHQGGLELSKKAGRSKALIPASRMAMSNIFRDRLLFIDSYMTMNRSDESYERYDNEDYHFQFGSLDRLNSLFETFGKDARRILINYRFMDETIRRDINKNIINKYANYFTQLIMIAQNDSGIWEEISNEKGVVQFPNVKKFTYGCHIADSNRTSFDLNKIFPNLESFKLFGSIKDPNCLANVTKLTELRLRDASIEEHHLPDIFAKNKQISELSFSTKSANTLRAIAQNLKNLQILKIRNAGSDFLIRATNRPVYNLTSVTNFDLYVYSSSEIIENLAFDMPNLKKMVLRVVLIDPQITNFINRFKHLESVRIIPYDLYNVVECIEKLTHAKEFTSPFLCSQISELTNFFETSKSNLKRLKLICYDEFESHIYDETMNEINEHLKESDKPTWTVSEGIHQELLMGGEDLKYLMFKRNP
ncbi:uncharacterized protein LOC116343358 [Contarinia nasturtii]|uniref:uncharacterized protein LOC116343358 n=1 Tax=Contarinia nasturtii TaxID=265458 RepID=UPI0012D3FC87|nr:uncharacterized protein LOC116343358 [Contarinia nasturtii]